jgi:hypothetical protein
MRHYLSIVMCQPLSFRLLLILVLLSYTIYIPVVFLKTKFFLIFFDVILIIALLTISFSARFQPKSKSVYFLYSVVILYVLSVSISFIQASSYVDLHALTVFRNFVFGMGILVVGISTITDKVKLDLLVVIFFWCSVVASIYGLRQVVFGYWGAELAHLQGMGSLMKEAVVLGRYRVTSTFGDPVLAGFYMMIGVYMAMLYKNMMFFVLDKKTIYTYFIVLNFIALLSTLTRGPLVSLFVGLIMITLLKAASDIRFFLRGLKYVGVVISLFVIVINTVESGMLNDSDNQYVRKAAHVLESVWSVAMLLDSRDDLDHFLVGQSKDARLAGWKEGVVFLSNHPLGVGLSGESSFSFSPGDTGVLQIGLLAGLPSFVFLIIIILYISVRGLFFVVSNRANNSSMPIIIIYGLWCAVVADTFITNMLDSAVASVAFWLVGAIVININKIYRRPVPTIENGTQSSLLYR